MTNREAKGILVDLEAGYRDLDPLALTDDGIRIVNERIEAVEVAISALEKQIPKKPVMGYAFSEKIREAIKRTNPERAESKTECCPVCGRPLGVSEFVKAQTGLRVGDPHCKKCGQAIDWEDNQWAN